MSGRSKKSELSKYFLFCFGILGLSITCLQGVMPFIEVSKLVRLLTENWVAVIRWPWLMLSEIVNFQIPLELIDGLNAVLFLVFFVLAFRRGDVFLLRISRRFGLGYGRSDFLSSTGIIRYLSRLVVFLIPQITVLWILTFHQPAMVAALFFAFCFDLVGRNDGIWGKLNRWVLGVSGARIEPSTPLPVHSIYKWFDSIDAPESSATARYEKSDALARNSILFMSSLLSWAICMILSVVLFFNFIALKSDVFIAKYNDIRCLAGIECIGN